MKIKSFFAAILAVFAFSACNNEVVSLQPETEESLANEDMDSQKKGYLILNLVNPATTRTSVGDSETDLGSDDENRINSLTVVFANKSGLITSVMTPEEMEGLTAKFQVALGGHYVYALVNSPIVVEEGQNINRVIEVASEEDATKGYKNGSFMMINKSNGGSEDVGVHTFISEKHSVNNPAIVYIQVDRIACKIYDATEAPVNVAFSESTKTVVDNVDVIGFALLNVNKKFNLIQTWSKDNDLLEEILLTPLYSGTGLIADQYFHNISNYTTLGKTNGDITSITDITRGVSNIYGRVPVYATENRPTIIDMGDDGITSGRAETTGVIYKVQAKKGTVNAETFYKYNNIVYKNLADIQVFPEFNDKELGEIGIPELRGLGIKVYEDGVMYYTYYIRDKNTAHQYGGENYYGVFRNSSYVLSISKISSIGDDVPGGGVVDPEKEDGPGNPPIDRQEAYISITLMVNPWILNNISIDF